MSATTLGDQLAALDALTQITTAFSHLPAADFYAGPIYPNRLTISLHDSFTDFEVWRTALGIPAEAVQFGNLTNQVHLEAVTQFAGATVELVGYGAALPTAGGAE